MQDLETRYRERATSCRFFRSRWLLCTAVWVLQLDSLRVADSWITRVLPPCYMSHQGGGAVRGWCSVTSPGSCLDRPVLRLRAWPTERGCVLTSPPSDCMHVTTVGGALLWSFMANKTPTGTQNPHLRKAGGLRS